jgi:hypothetical protein
MDPYSELRGAVYTISDAGLQYEKGIRDVILVVVKALEIMRKYEDVFTHHQWMTEAYVDGLLMSGTTESELREALSRMPVNMVDHYVRFLSSMS